MSTLVTTLEIGGVKRSVEVGYVFYPATHGARGSCGEPLEPDDPPFVEVRSYKINDENLDAQLTAGQLELLERRCLDNELGP